MHLFQRTFSIFRFGISMRQYTPTEKPVAKDIQLPKRPKLDPKDPKEIYEMPTMPEFAFRQMQDQKPKWRSYPGTYYVSVQRNGINYHLFDASRIPYGKMCVRIATYLTGKHKPIYRNNQPGFSDKCVVVNAQDIYLTGKKLYQKRLTYHTGYVGNLKKIRFTDMIIKKPEQLVAWSVSKMMTKTRHRFDRLDNLYVFRGREHTFTDVLPQILPHQVDFEYHGSLLKDINDLKDGKVIYASTGPDSSEFKEDLGDRKVDFMDEEELDKEELFQPFSERGYKVKRPISQKEYEKIERRRKRVMQRYRRQHVKMPKQDQGYNPKRSYLVTSEHQLRKLKLMNQVPHDDDPEVEEELLKM